MSQLLDPIEEELVKAGEASSVSPTVVKLDKFRIMSDTDVPPEEFLMRFFGKPCFPRRDLSTITGTEKCGKTFFTSMLMACCAEKSVLELERIRDEPLKVMWYDTEQSRQSTKSILTDRIFKMATKGALDNRFFVFNVRACTCEERMDYLVAGIEAYKPDMVIIDNVSDLLPSINDAEGSIKLIDRLMQIATTYDCNITIVIHLNRSGEKRNLRGWLGTEILHKAFDVYYCEQIEKSDVFDRTGHPCRLDFERFGAQIGLTNARIKRVLDKYMLVPELTTKLVGNSFLNDKMKRKYLRIVDERIKRFVRKSE